MIPSWLDLPSYEDFVSATADVKCELSHQDAEQLAAAVVAHVGAEPRQHNEFEELQYVTSLCRPATDDAVGLVTPSTILELRYNLRREFQPDRTVKGLWDAVSVEEVLAWLFIHAVDHRLTNIRFYPLHHDRYAGYSLMSYASAGHDPEITRRLRVGQITKFLAHSRLETHDSFWSLALGVPTMFVIDDSCAMHVECLVSSDAVPLVRVSRNNCMNVLVRHNSDAWVDFPLFGGRTPTGKLSCDLAVNVELVDGIVGAVTPQLTEDLLRFAGYVQLAAARLDVLYRQELQSRHQ